VGTNSNIKVLVLLHKKFILYIRKTTIFETKRLALKRKGANFRLHPLIHTPPESPLAHDVERKKNGAKDSASS